MGRGQQLGLPRSRFYSLFSDYPRACARQQAQLWLPGTSGGDQATPWPKPVADLLTKTLGLRLNVRAKRLPAFPLTKPGDKFPKCSNTGQKSCSAIAAGRAPC